MYMDHLVAHTTLWKIEDQTFGEEEEEEAEGHDDDEPGHGHGHDYAPGPDFQDLHRRLHGLDADGNPAEGNPADTGEHGASPNA
jgi:hypothetical protein